ncbi:signal peptidase I [Thermodesulfobacteriota bacterium]
MTIKFTGYSMYPRLRPGDQLVVKRLSAESLQVGDIAVYTNSGKNLIAHRLIKRISHSECVFKGDSLLNPDHSTISNKDIIGRVDAIIRKDRIISNNSRLGRKINRLIALLSCKNLTSGTIRLRIKILLRRFNSD